MANDQSLTVKTKGFDGCAQMLRKGANQIKLFAAEGLTRFVIAYDSDGNDSTIRREEVMQKIVRPSTASHADCCIVIPVQEIEAWILADIKAISKVVTSWDPDVIDAEPESIASPKEYLESLSRNRKKRPVYEHTTHNPLVAKHLNLETVKARCPSFAPLVNFVTIAG